MVTSDEKEPQHGSADEARRYIDAIVERDSEKRAEPAKRHRPSRSRSVDLGLALLVFTGLSAWNLRGFRTDPQIFTDEEKMADAYFSVLFAAEAIRSYRDSTGMLPIGLDIVDAEADRLRYDSEPHSYRLSMQVMDSTVVYTDGADMTPLEEEFNRLTVAQQ